MAAATGPASPPREGSVLTAFDPGDSSRTDAGPALRAGEFVALVALLMSLVALAIDAMLPALTEIGRDFGVLRPNDTQFVVTALFLGLGVGQILFGPLSDRVGRRAAVHAGLLLFMAGCSVSMFAPTFEVMIAGRVLQGIGAGAPRIVTIAMVRDQYEGRRMARIMSLAMSVFILVPTVAPALGQGILWLGGWRAIFATILGVAAVALTWFALRQPETLPPDRRRPLSPRGFGRAVLEVLRTRPALGYTLATACVFAPFLAYLSSARQIFHDAYRTGALFPLWFGVLALAFGCASLVNGRLVMKHGMRRLSNAAALAVTLVSFVAWALAFAFKGLPPFGLFVGYLLVAFFCMGLTFGNLNALAMKSLGHIAGVGAAVVASLTTLIGVPFGVLLGQSFDGTLYVQIGAFAVFGAATLAASRWAEGGGTLDGHDLDAIHRST